MFQSYRGQAQHGRHNQQQQQHPSYNFQYPYEYPFPAFPAFPPAPPMSMFPPTMFDLPAGPGPGPVPVGPTPTPTRNNNSSIDWHETVDAHVMKAYLPGFKKEEVRLEMEQEEEEEEEQGRHGGSNCIHLRCEKKADKEDKGEGWYHSHRTNGRFDHRLRLPHNSTPDNIKAELENGVLTVTIPKKRKESLKKSSRIILIS